MAGAVMLVALVGCVKNLQEEFPSDMRIDLNAKVAASVLSKASVEGSIDYDTDAVLDITLIRWDQSTGGDATSGREELAATMETYLQDGSWQRPINFEKPQYYVSKTDTVGFAGWYPDSGDDGWVKTAEGAVIADDNTMTYNIDGTTDVMVSSFATGTYETGVEPLQFHHALCMYNIYIYAVDKDASAEWGKLTELQISNLPQQVIISLPEDITSGSLPLYDFRYGQNPQPYDFPELGTSPRDIPYGTPNTASVQSYIGTVLSGAPGNGLIGISARTENYSSGNSVSIARDFTPGYTYNIFIRFSSKGIINAEVSVADWEYDKGDYVIDENFHLLSDLSRYGTSNSYIVSSANRGYSFDCTVKGNGVNVLTRRDGSTIVLPDRDNTLNPARLEILRSDAMTRLNTATGEMEVITDLNERKNAKIIELVFNEPSSGKAVFNVIGNSDDPDDSRLIYEGNVKIGALDAAGNIIWSWHIWVTDKPINQGYSNGYVALDRNLGAVIPDEEGFREGYSQWAGLYYQWGRKDPIFRATVATAEDDPEFAGTWDREVVDHPVTVAEAHRNPVTYYYDPAGNNWTTDTENNEHFWGYISIRDDVRKTLYDPCPPGYRVPDNPLWQTSTPQYGSEDIHTPDGTFAGYKFRLSNNIEVFYPTAECIADGRMRNNDKRSTDDRYYVFQNTANPYDSDLYGHGDDPTYEGLSYHFRYNERDLGENYSEVLTADNDRYYAGRSAAYPVRCVLESSAPVVTDLSAVQTANSYIIERSGFYRFRVNVRGNGVTGLNIEDATEPGKTFYRPFDANMGSGINIDEIAKVDILWWQGDLRAGSAWRSFAASDHSAAEIEDECPVAILDGGDVSDGFVVMYVTVNENTRGNVGLAAYDTNGGILWSWHLWIQPDISLVRFGDYTLMDRNLGATYAPSGALTTTDETDHDLTATTGFFYQWGRKDPFAGPLKLIDSGNNTQPWFRQDARGNWYRETTYLTATKGTIPDSVKDPLHFFTSGDNFWQTNYTKPDDASNDLWGYVGRSGFKGDSFAKTMYDPCPPGYRVMQHNVFHTANICSDNANDKYTLYRSDGNEYDCRFGIFFSSDLRAMGNLQTGRTWFPNSGVIAADGVNTNNGNIGRVSTATPMGSDPVDNVPTKLHTREMRWERLEHGWLFKSYDYEIQQNNGTGGNSSQSWMSEARVVRCQME